MHWQAEVWRLQIALMLNLKVAAVESVIERSLRPVEVIFQQSEGQLPQPDLDQFWWAPAAAASAACYFNLKLESESESIPAGRLNCC